MQNDRDRLIELLIHSSRYIDQQRGEVIADHLLSNGVMVPPCKVGDKVYLPNLTDWGTFECYEIIEFIFDGKQLYFAVDDEDRETFLIEEIGNTVFLTREEAEKALERSKDDEREYLCRRYQDLR